MQKLAASRDLALGKPPRRVIHISFLLDQEVEISLALPVQAFQVAIFVARVDARCWRLVLVTTELLQVLSGHACAWGEGMVRTESRSEGFAVALALLKVEFGLEEGSGLEVELVGEGIVQRALDASLVGIVGAFERRRCASEDGRTVENDRGVQARTWGFLWTVCRLSCQTPTKGQSTFVEL